MPLILRCAEGEEPAVTVLHDEFTRVPWRVAEGSRELDSAGRKLQVQRVAFSTNNRRRATRPRICRDLA